MTARNKYALRQSSVENNRHRRRASPIVLLQSVARTRRWYYGAASATPPRTPSPRRSPIVCLPTPPASKQQVFIDLTENSTPRPRRSRFIDLTNDEAGFRALSPKSNVSSPGTVQNDGFTALRSSIQQFLEATRSVANRSSPKVIVSPMRRRRGRYHDFAPQEAEARNNSFETSRFMPKIARPLLFRFYSDESAGQNTKQGIRSGRFAHIPGLDIKDHVPSVHSVLFDAEIHISRIRADTALISTTSSLLFALNLLIHDQGSNKRVAIIDGLRTSAHTQIYHNPRIVDALREKGRFGVQNVRAGDGTFRRADGKDGQNTLGQAYSGEIEYMVYGEIPKRAITATIDIDDLQLLSDTYQNVARLLRLNIIRRHKRMRQLGVALSERPPVLTPEIGKAVAQVLSICNVRPHSDLPILKAFVNELTSTHLVKLPKQNNRVDNDKIARASSTFALMMCEGLPVGDREHALQSMEDAFMAALSGRLKAARSRKDET